VRLVRIDPDEELFGGYVGHVVGIHYSAGTTWVDVALPSVVVTLDHSRVQALQA